MPSNINFEKVIEIFVDRFSVQLGLLGRCQVAMNHLHFALRGIPAVFIVVRGATVALDAVGWKAMLTDKSNGLHFCNGVIL